MENPSPRRARYQCSRQMQYSTADAEDAQKERELPKADGHVTYSNSKFKCHYNYPNSQPI